MTPEREKMIRDTWAAMPIDADWFRHNPGRTRQVLPRQEVRRSPPDLGEPVPDTQTIQFMTFARDGVIEGGVHFWRIVCEGVVLDQGEDRAGLW